MPSRAFSTKVRYLLSFSSNLNSVSFNFVISLTTPNACAFPLYTTFAIDKFMKISFPSALFAFTTYSFSKRLFLSASFMSRLIFSASSFSSKVSKFLFFNSSADFAPNIFKKAGFAYTSLYEVARNMPSFECSEIMRYISSSLCI